MRGLFDHDCYRINLESDVGFGPCSCPSVRLHSRVEIANCGASKDNLPLCGVGAEGAEKFLGYLTSTFEDFLHFLKVSEGKID